MKRLLPALLTLCLLSGCATAQKEAAETAVDLYTLYYATDPNFSMGGDGIAATQIVLEGAGALTPQARVETVVRRLLEGTEDVSLVSPFPKGTVLESVTLDGHKATVDLSAAYGSLAGIQLTLADYCITLSLTELEGISEVAITVQGEELAYRNAQSFRAKDVLLTSREDVVSTLEVTLWFADTVTGALTPESRTLELYEGDTQTESLMAALLSGPESKSLVSALPENFAVLSIWTEEDVCYVNLPFSVLETAVGESARRTIQVLVESLCSLENIEGVQLRVDGESRPLFGPVPIGGILQPMG